MSPEVSGGLRRSPEVSETLTAFLRCFENPPFPPSLRMRLKSPEGSGGLRRSPELPPSFFSFFQKNTKITKQTCFVIVVRVFAAVLLKNTVSFEIIRILEILSESIDFVQNRQVLVRNPINVYKQHNSIHFLCFLCFWDEFVDFGRSGLQYGSGISNSVIVDVFQCYFLQFHCLNSIYIVV